MMSSRGVTRAQLEARRREMERQREEQRRKEVMANIQAVAAEIRRQHGDLVEQGHAAWVAEELKRQFRRVQAAEQASLAEVDAAFSDITEVRTSLDSLAEVAQSRRSEAEFQALQDEIRADAARLRLLLLADQASSAGAKHAMATLSRKAKDVVEGRSSEDITTLEVEAQRVLAEDAAEAVDETLRREVVSAIMQAMRVQGFATSKPVVHTTTGHVVISGTLPGGRKVRFDVALDGAMHFDMDGFADRSCADHLDQVLERMEQEFSVATGPVQHTWKNPDRISKGSRGMPGGGPGRTMGGGA